MDCSLVYHWHSCQPPWFLYTSYGWQPPGCPDSSSTAVPASQLSFSKAGIFPAVLQYCCQVNSCTPVQLSTSYLCGCTAFSYQYLLLYGCQLLPYSLHLPPCPVVVLFASQLSWCTAVSFQPVLLYSCQLSICSPLQLSDSKLSYTVQLKSMSCWRETALWVFCCLSRYPVHVNLLSR